MRLVSAKVSLICVWKCAIHQNLQKCSQVTVCDYREKQNETLHIFKDFILFYFKFLYSKWYHRINGVKNKCGNVSHKTYSAIPRFCMEGLLKMLDFAYFVPIWWQSDKNTNCLINYRIQYFQHRSQWAICN